MKVLVEFTKDYANKKKGDREQYDAAFASSLIRQRKVAKQVKERKKKAK